LTDVKDAPRRDFSPRWRTANLGVNNLADGRIIELLPLESSDIVRFAEAMKGRVPHLDGWEFTRRLEAYPDLARLARIPLFLAMLIALAGAQRRCRQAGLIW
jgi:hypothetical protein